MTLSNWIELAILLVISLAGGIIWRYFRRKLHSHNGFEGVIVTRGRHSPRKKMDIEEEYHRLKAFHKSRID